MNHTFKVGDKVYVDNQHGCKGHGEIIALLQRPPESKEPYIVVKLSGLNGEYVQAVFEKDILPPTPTVVFERWLPFYAGNSAHGYQDDASLGCPFSKEDELLRVYKLSDGTWKIEKVA